MKTKTIEERANEVGIISQCKSDYCYDKKSVEFGYIQGAGEQKIIDDELCKNGEASDGYHTFNELYDFRREYNAALVNFGVWKAHKSYRHHSGELCFGGWFIVMIETPFGQISNHYENKYSVIENGQKNPAETTEKRYKNVNLVIRTQKWMGLVGCFGQKENIKRQSLYYH